MAKLPRVTILQLDPRCPAGSLEPWLKDAGVRLSQVTLWDRDVPPIASIGDGLVILGGRMSAHAASEHPWLLDLADLVADAHDIDLPILGICLGHQVVADALGGTVVVAHPDGPEEGAVALELLPAAADDPVLGGLAGFGDQAEVIVAQSHHDVVTVLPAGAVELARTARYANQAFRLGSSWGVQFHPEATPELMDVWTQRSRDRKRAVASVRDAQEAIEASGRAIAQGFAQFVRG